MSYTKNTWIDQDVERPKTYEVTNNQDGSITLTDSFGLVQELGTPVNAVNMNHIEDGIDGCAIRKHNLTETFNLGEWVLGGSGDDEGIYKSLVANNVGNAVTDDTKWENATDLNGKANVSADNFNATGTTYLSGLGMPSSRYIDLTLGAPGTTYTAPANGWVQCSIKVNSGYVIILKYKGNSWSGDNDTLYRVGDVTTTSTWVDLFLPVFAGEKFSVHYSSYISTLMFRFIYAVGSQQS